MRLHVQDPLYRIHDLPDSELLNPAIFSQVMRLADAPAIRRSHFFRGRFENIYIPLAQVPEVAAVLAFAERCAADLLGMAPASLRCGFWFNLMPPGAVTLLHTHEEDDELMSAVYYVKVPADSGDLILEPGAAGIRITPRAGRLVLFSPSMPHEVTENRSAEVRLSIGINIGPVPASRDR